MQLSLEVIDFLRANALVIGSVLREATITPNKFWDAGGNILPRYDMAQKELICYVGSGKVSFSDIRPSEVISLDVSDPAEFNTQRDKYVLDVYPNAGSSPLNIEETYTEEHSHTVKTDIMAELSTSIKSKVGGSYAGFSAELEAQLSAKLGVNHSDEETNKQGITKKLSFSVPPWKQASVAQEHSISDVAEHISLVCKIDASITLDGGWEKSFDSFGELTLYLQGGGGGTGDAQELDNFVKNRVFEHFSLDEDHFAMPSTKRFIHIEKDRISRNVSTGKIERTETEIEHGGI